MEKQRAWLYNNTTESVEISRIDIPKIEKHEVLIENKAVGINPVDWKFIEANPLNWRSGHVPGVDGSGIIVEVGEDVDPALIGLRVNYHTSLKCDGSFAEYTVIKPERLMRLPDCMPYTQAAALPCPMLTAWQAFEKVPLSRNQQVLVAGFGAVNKTLTQLLIAAGYVVDVVSSSLSEQQAELLGINKIYRDNSTILPKYYAIYDAVSGQNAADLSLLLKANGHIVCIQDRIAKPIDPAFTRTISYHEVALGALHEFGDNDDWKFLMKNGEALLNKVGTGELKVSAADFFEFELMLDALSHSKETKNKTIIVVN
ncbi:alcohol dehydrogenase catalytic domain-containing protein [Photobacterium sp. DNB23_23_1]